jgi:hypothetical protein
MATAMLAGTAATNTSDAAYDRSDSISVPGWLAVIVGCMIMAAGPAFGSGLFAAANEWLHSLSLSCALGAATAFVIMPTVVAAILATLCGRPLWQRFAMFAPAFAMQFVVYVVCCCPATYYRSKLGACCGSARC